MKAASIKDISESLKVSKTLVSLVLNNKGEEYGISPITQKKVREKAKELNYSPNRMAQGLRLGKSKSIGLIVPDISNPFYSKISRYISDFVDKQGYNLTIYNTDEDEQKEKKLIQNLLERNIDGIILTSTSMQINELTNLNSNNTPYIMVDRYIKGVETNYVGVDNYQGAVDSVKYLLKKGSEKIAFITVGPEFVSSLEERKKGYIDTLKEHDIVIDKNMILTVSYNQLEKELDSKLELLFNNPQRPDALFIANNKLAIETLKKLKQLKIKIPENVSIVSFDDIPLFDILPFPVNTVAQPIKDICAEAIRILFEEINSKESVPELKRQKTILPACLIQRG